MLDKNLKIEEGVTRVEEKNYRMSRHDTDEKQEIINSWGYFLLRSRYVS